MGVAATRGTRIEPDSHPTVPPAAGGRTTRRDHVFFRTMTVALTLTVLIGFGPSYYWRFLSDGPASTLSGGPFTALVHVHAAAFTAWALLFLTQTLLVSAGRVSAHRRLGMAGAGLAAAMVVSGVLAALDAAARGLAPGRLPPDVFVATPLFSMALFATFVSAALLRRRNRDAHKRLMLLAYFFIILPAIARIPGAASLGLAGPVFVLLFIAAGMIYDRLSRGRVHPVYLWGALTYVGVIALRVVIAPTPAWRQFVQWLVS